MSEVAELRERIASLAAKNERLSKGLVETTQKLRELHEQLSALATPPLRHGTFLSFDGKYVSIAMGSSIMEMPFLPELEPATWFSGTTVLVNDNSIVVGRVDAPARGEMATVLETTEDGRAIVSLSGGSHMCVLVPGHLLLEVGDSVIVDGRVGLVIDKIVRRDVEQLLTPHVPTVQWSQIGGLSKQIERIRDAVELPFLEPELYKRFDLRPPRGVLLYGPPGCGKTLIAKAVAHSLAVRKGGSGYFLSVKGPELLNKFVGETERHIRAIFARARALASPTKPVVIFFDEMEALFKTRGSGISSDTETLIVPQLLAELDGVEAMRDVIVIGASNRQDMIDPAVLRPGRLDVQVEITRPDRAAAASILEILLHDAVPIEAGHTHSQLRELTVDSIFESSPVNHLDSIIVSGRKYDISMAAMISGAILAGIVELAKKQAIKRAIEQRDLSHGNADTADKAGVTWADLQAAISIQRDSLLNQVRGMDEHALALSLGGSLLESRKQIASI